jgi:hypothetical protein
MHTKSGNSQWVKQKQASILFSGHKSTHETATNSQKMTLSRNSQIFIIHQPKAGRPPMQSPCFKTRNDKLTNRYP